MGDLIGLLIIIGIGAISSSLKRKKQQQKHADKTRAFQEAAQSIEEGKARVNRQELAGMLQAQLNKQTPPKAAPRQQVQIEKIPAAPKAKAAAPVAKPPAPKKAAPPAKKIAPMLFLDNDAPEGSISTQGENPAEHARHRQKVLAEEEQLRLEHQALQEVRSMNLQKLRTAVVMSEILDKPVSLRPRRFQ